MLEATNVPKSLNGQWPNDYIHPKIKELPLSNKQLNTHHLK
jgi:hypothetical protein